MDNEYRINDAEEFKNSGGRFTPLISVGEAGGIGISSGFAKKYELNNKNTKSVRLFYWKDKVAIGLMFLEKLEESTLKLRFTDDERGGAYVNAKPFWIKFDIEYKNFVRKYIPKEITTEKGKIYVIELREKQLHTGQ